MPCRLSDHADYDELFEAVARVEPRVVYCTHGPESFVDRLRDAGYDAHPAGPPHPGTAVLKFVGYALPEACHRRRRFTTMNTYGRVSP